MQFKVKGSDFKAAIAAVTKFPSVGTFVGSDIISLSGSKNVLTCTSFGTVLARVRVPCDGDMPVFGVDERAIGQFASLCRATSEVLITVDEKQSKFRRGNTEITTPLSKGQTYTFAKHENKGLTLTWEASKDLGYLSNIAMSDTSKPELNAVLLQGEQALACGQMVAAMLQCPVSKTRAALPLPLIKGLSKEDTIFAGSKETTLKSGIAEYSMPTPALAQEKFPYDQVVKYGKVATEAIASLPGTRLKNALEECTACISNVSRLEVIVGLRFAAGKLEIVALNGGVKFRKVLGVTKIKDAELNLPLTEATAAAALFENKKVDVLRGKNNETMLKFTGGWLLFPAWAQKGNCK